MLHKCAGCISGAELRDDGVHYFADGSAMLRCEEKTPLVDPIVEFFKQLQQEVRQL